MAAEGFAEYVMGPMIALPGNVLIANPIAMARSAVPMAVAVLAASVRVGPSV